MNGDRLLGLIEQLYAAPGTMAGWDAFLERLRWTMQGSPARCSTPPGNQLLTTSRDATIRLWNVGRSLAELIAGARQRVPRQLTHSQEANFFLRPDFPLAERRPSQIVRTPTRTETRSVLQFRVSPFPARQLIRLVKLESSRTKSTQRATVLVAQLCCKR
jgi:hypothetical protein